MLFAHAPVGFLISYFTRKFWNRGLSLAQFYILLILGAFFGVFPDLDVFYYYFVNARALHREVIFHSFVLYLVIFAILYFVGRVMKNAFCRALSFVFFFGTLSHLVLDSLAAGIMWVYPINHRLFGLLIIPQIADSFFGQYFTLINFSLEVVLTILGIGVVTKKYFSQYWKKFKIIAVIIVVILAICEVAIAPRTFQPTHPGIKYQDRDHDNIINLYDPDMDGDKKTTLDDKDVDGDKIDNNTEIIAAALKMNGQLRDPLNGHILEILPRYGFLTDSDMIKNAYEAAGIFLTQLVIDDYQKNPQLYRKSPKNSGFSRDLYNLFIFFRNNGMLKDGSRELQKGDIVFYGNNFKRVGIIARKNEKLEKEVLVIDGISAKIIPHTLAIEKFGAPLAAARLKKY